MASEVHETLLPGINEKKVSGVDVREVSPIDSVEERERKQAEADAAANANDEIRDDGWLPGSNSPWIAGIEIALAVLCSIAAIIVVCLSDGKRQGSWYIRATKHTKQVTVEPKLLLSVLSSVATLMIGLALKEGVTVSWWQRALKGGRVKDLERHWTLGSSVLRASLAGKRNNQVGIALLIITITAIAENTLMQRATGIASQPVKDTASFTMSAQIASKLPATGFESQAALAHITTNLVPSFAEIMRQYTNRSPINSSFSGCEGTCFSFVPGAGFAVVCSQNETEFEMGPTIYNETWPQTLEMIDNGNNYPEEWWTPYTVFNSTFSIGNSTNTEGNTYETIYYDTQSSHAVTLDNGDCKRTVVNKYCSLLPAIVKYPVIIRGDVVSLDKTALNGSQVFEVERYLNLSTDEYQFSALGGVDLAFGRNYNSMGQLYWNNRFGDGYMFNTTGALVYSFLGLTDKTVADFTYNCDAPFLDSSSEVLSALHDVMFRMAINASTPTDRIPIQATNAGYVNYYQSSYLFLGLAVGLVVINILVVVPLFWGYWQLGRKVTLNPVEIAEAFNAPVLRKDTAHRDIDGLLKEVGDRPLVFKPVQRVASADGVERRTVTRMQMVQVD